MRTTFVLSICLIFGINLQAQPAEEIDWQYEIDLLARELAERHIALFRRTDSATFFASMKRVANRAAGKSLFDVSVWLQQVIALQGDAQTQVNYHYNIDKARILPLEYFWFEDGLYILKAPAAHRELLGKRLVAINGFPVERVVDSLSTLIVADNHSTVKNSVPRMLTWIQLLHHFGFTDPMRIKVEVEDPNGQKINRELELPLEKGDEVTVSPAAIPYGWEDRKTYFREHYFPGERIYFIQYNKCWSREAEEKFGTGATALFMPSFREFEKKIFQTLRKREIDKLVFDLRFNTGGSEQQGTRLIKKLAGRKMKGQVPVYLIVGRQTYAAAIVNSADLIRQLDAIVVGEATGGRPNHFGEVNRFVLPESRLVVSYSTKYFALSEKDDASIIPEIEVPLTYDVFMSGTDPAMEAIRKHFPR